MASAAERYQVEDFRAIPGKGAEGKVNGKEVKVVSPGFLKEHGINLSDKRVDELSSQGKTVVFVRTDEGFEPKPVTLGKTSETHVQIVAGMKPGQQYVVKGAFTLKAQLAKGGFSAGHSH